ncbi:MAG: GNAT family N-acetyltransferase [Candidatus Latescibacteria bacterium]|nr:GNAT family N-acetyltransferase [Candidatus Latescibacterota bacterium]
MTPWQLKHITYQSPQEDKDQVKDLWEGLYIWATNSRLNEPWENEKYGFVAAYIDNTCVGTTSYTISARGQGILSQVQTQEQYRGRGIASSIMSEVMDTFRKNGARAVYLAAWDEWIRNIYRKFGFVNVGNMGKRGAFKITLTDAGKDEILFRADQQVTIRPLGIGDQTDITSLFCTQHPCVVKNYELGCYLGSYFEGEFFILQNQVVQGIVPEERKPKKGYRCFVLDGEETILGLGTVIPSSRRHEGHTGIIDMLIHPAYSALTQDMLDKLEENCELDHLTAYIEENESTKREFYEKNGYKKLTELEKQLTIGEESFNLMMYRKNF